MNVSVVFVCMAPQYQFFYLYTFSRVRKFLKGFQNFQEYFLHGAGCLVILVPRHALGSESWVMSPRSPLLSLEKWHSFLGTHWLSGSSETLPSHYVLQMFNRRFKLDELSRDTALWVSR